MSSNHWMILCVPYFFLLFSPTGLRADNSEAIAIRALNDLGSFSSSQSGKCTGCHDPNAIVVRQWINQAIDVSRECNLNLTIPPNNADEARKQISCLKQNTPDKGFSARRLGLLSAGVNSEDFRRIFEVAFRQSNQSWQDQFNQFKQSAGMPMDANYFTEDAWQNLKSWIFATESPGPHLERLLALPSPQESEDCVPHISGELKSYLAMRQNDNWSTRNRDNGMKMFGCDSLDMEPNGCFEQRTHQGIRRFPEWLNITNPSGRFSSGDHRILSLTELGFIPNFWVRSSPDGRFIANGASNSTRKSIIADLGYYYQQIGHPYRQISIAADFDPTFFPDNSGFIFHRDRDKPGFCNMNVLRDPAISRITFNEHGCAIQDGVALYQSVGTNLNGTDYFAIGSTFVNDRYTYEPVERPDWLSQSKVKLSRMFNNGRYHQVRHSQELQTPYQGDFQMSSSTNLVISRVSRKTQSGRIEQSGYAIDRLVIDNQNKVSMQPLGRLCKNGGKANFSFDERYVAFHKTTTFNDHLEFGYASADAPDFQNLIGTNNVYITDLVTGETKRVTSMPPQQHAKYPHFRSDGWLYFMVQYNGRRFYMAASNAALK